MIRLPMLMKAESNLPGPATTDEGVPVSVRIRERLAVWKGSGITTLIVGARTPDAVRLMAELAL